MEPSQLAKHHPALFTELCNTAQVARLAGDPPGDLYDMVDMLLTEAITLELEKAACLDCSAGTLHEHTSPLPK